MARPKKGATAESRWIGNVEHGGPWECWIWRGRPNGNGYGALRVCGKTVPAHRFGYEMLVGKIPVGMEIDHLCRNRLCVNPHHLEPVSRTENWRRGMSPSAENARKTRCVKGHLLAGRNLLPTRPGRQCRECNRINASDWRKRMIAAGAARDERGRVVALAVAKTLNEMEPTA